MNRLEALKQIGNEWQKYGKHRIYFNDLGSRLGVETSRYNTGNICSATLYGEKISNSAAKRILSRAAYSKVWYDLADDEFHTTGELWDEEFEEIVTSIKEEAAQ